MLWCLQITPTYLAHREQSQHMIRLDPNTDCLLGYDQTSLRHLGALPSDPHQLPAARQPTLVEQK